jgi:cyclohexyl-isocyanide hydratase
VELTTGESAPRLILPLAWATHSVFDSRSCRMSDIPAYPATPEDFHVTVLLFPGVTQLDFTGPLEVLQRVPKVRVDLVWKDLEPVSCAAWVPPAMRVLPSARFEDIERTDLLLVPGGPGVDALLTDDATLACLRRLAESARFVTSVCTGSLVLGAAGLLRGYRATTHWAHLQWLPEFGIIPVQERVVVDRNRITGAGVSSGIDFALRAVASIWGDERAKRSQLSMEYDPQPPFDSGTPATASPELVSSMREMLAPLTERTGAAVMRASRRLKACEGGTSVP